MDGQVLHLEYIAGLLDGEGNIGIGGQRHIGKKINSLGSIRFIDHIKWSRRISIANTYLPVLNLLREQYGGTVYKAGTPIYKGKDNEHWKQCYRWNIHGGKSAEFLKKIYPFLVIKRDRAKLFLEFSETVRKPGQHTLPEEIIKLRYEVYKKLITLNSNGTGPKRVGKITLPEPRFATLVCGGCGRKRRVTLGSFNARKDKSELDLCFNCYSKRVKEGTIIKKRDELGKFI